MNLFRKMARAERLSSQWGAAPLSKHPLPSARLNGYTASFLGQDFSASIFCFKNNRQVQQDEKRSKARLLTGWDDVSSDGAEAGNASGTYALTPSGIRAEKGAEKNWPEGKPYEERGGRVLLWPVAQAVPSGKDTRFPADANTTGAKVADALESNSSVAHQRQRLHRIWRCVILEPDLAHGGVGSEFEELASPALSGSPAGSSAIDGGDQHRNRAVHRDANTRRMYLHSVTTKENLRDGQVNPGLAPKNPSDPGLSRQGGISILQ